MFVLINEIGLESLPEGNIQSRSISREEAVQLIQEHREKVGVTGAFDIGPVPDERKQGKFREALEIIHSADLPLTEADFQGQAEGGDGELRTYTIPPEICPLRADRPILVIIYGYTLNPDQKPAITPNHEGVRYRLFSLMP